MCWYSVAIMPVLHATVRGLVQGVGFRWFVCREARVLGLTGRVSNRPDGSVEVTAEGARAHLETLLSALKRGPEVSRVERVEHVLSEGTVGLVKFVIE